MSFTQTTPHTRSQAFQAISRSRCQTRLSYPSSSSTDAGSDSPFRLLFLTTWHQWSKTHDHRCHKPLSTRPPQWMN